MMRLRRSHWAARSRLPSSATQYVHNDWTSAKKMSRYVTMNSSSDVIRYPTSGKLWATEIWNAMHDKRAVIASDDAVEISRGGSQNTRYATPRITSRGSMIL